MFFQPVVLLIDGFRVSLMSSANNSETSIGDDYDNTDHDLTDNIGILSGDFTKEEAILALDDFIDYITIELIEET